jgi:ankyrin repeat protein
MVNYVVYDILRRDDLEAFKKCITENIIDIWQQDSRYKRTLLHNAAVLNAYNCLQFLLDCGIDANSIDYIGNTSLHAAALYAAALHLNDCINHLDVRQCIKALLDAGANINALNHDDRTPFMFLIPRRTDYKNDNMLRLLIDRGADIIIGDWTRVPIIPIHIQEFIKSRNLTRVTAIAFITLYKKAYVGGNGKDVLRLIGKHIWSMRMM